MSLPPVPEPEVSTPDPQPPKGALGIIFLIVLSDLMGFGLLVPVAWKYAKDFNASDFQIGWLTAIFSLCTFIAAPILGSLSDRKGRRPILIYSQLGSVAGYLLLAFTVLESHRFLPFTGLCLLFASRIIDGLSGGNISTAQAYIADVTGKENRAKAMGMLGAAFGIGFSIGPGISALLSLIHISAPALAAAGFSALACALTYFKLPETRRHTPAQNQSWLHPSRFAPIFRKPLLLNFCAIGAVSMFAFVMLEAVFALFLAARFGFGPKTIGFFFCYVGIIIVIVQGGLIGRLNKRFGEWPLVIAGPIMVTVAMMLYVEIARGGGLWLIFVAGLLNAGGRSLQTPTLNALVSKTAGENDQGLVAGFFQGLMAISRVGGPLLATAVFTNHHAMPFLISAVLTLIVALWTIAICLRYARGAGDVNPQPTPPGLAT